MPLLLVLFVAAACLPVPWPASPLGLGPAGSTAATGAVTLASLVLAVTLSVVTVRGLYGDPARRSQIVARYGRFRRRLGLANLGAAAVAIAGLGWGHTVWHAPELAVVVGSRAVLVPAGELLVPAPYFVFLFAAWAVYFPADRAIHRTSAAVTTTSDPPEFWSLGGYWLFHARQFVLMVAFPVGLFVSQQGIARVAPRTADDLWFKAASVVAVGGLFVLLPRAVKPLLGLTPLPPGAKRERLEATARRLNFRFAGLLLWPTRGAVANALVIGVVPWARYIIFTDRLLDAMDEYELDAVLGHEVGHAAHGHIPYYAGFLVASAAAGTAAVAGLDVLLAENGVDSLAELGGWVAVPPLVLMAGYLFVVFGMLSRRCERQADVYGARAGSCGEPDCRGHDPETVLVPAGGPVCPSGARALIRALDRVAALNGMDNPASGGPRGFRARVWAWLKAWQHGPIPDRIEFLLQLTEDPSLADRSDRRAFRFRVGLMVVLAATVGVLGSLVGWAELLRQL